jgi:hypothetical protein
MELVQRKITIQSKNYSEIISPAELLLPLNGLVNAINLFQDFDNIYHQFERRQIEQGKLPDFQKFITIQLSEGKFRVKSNLEKEHERKIFASKISGQFASELSGQFNRSMQV